MWDTYRNKTRKRARQCLALFVCTPDMRFCKPVGVDALIDPALSETAEEDKSDDSDSELIEKFKKEINDDSLKIEVHALKNASVPAVMLLGEQSRRMQEMYRSYGQQMAGMADMFKNEYTLVINKNNELIKKLGSLNDEDASLLMDHIYDMARISHSPLTGEQMTKFIERSNKLLEKIF